MVVASSMQALIRSSSALRKMDKFSIFRSICCRLRSASLRISSHCPLSSDNSSANWLNASASRLTGRLRIYPFCAMRWTNWSQPAWTMQQSIIAPLSTLFPTIQTLTSRLRIAYLYRLQTLKSEYFKNCLRFRFTLFYTTGFRILIRQQLHWTDMKLRSTSGPLTRLNNL